ncbi:MAG: FtsW/RodA/SpoVE family cell cycle protein [Parvularculaceae bacterium]
MKALSRIDTSLLARWWWSVDRVTLALVALIVTSGFVVLMAAGPAAAARLRIADSFHFPIRQLLFLGPALGLMLAVSLSSPLQARRLGAVVFAAALVLMLLALFIAPEVNGAKRWISIGAFNLQPSEFAKPGFAVIAAWMLAEGARHPRFPGAFISGGFFLAVASLLVLQPDYGQAALLAAVWMVMFFVVGCNWAWIAALFALGSATFAGGYFFSPHFARRIDGFLNPQSAETYQVDKALEAIANGGLIGRGGEGATVKMQLPDAHTDFIFAVAGEEGGFILAFVILALFAALVARILIKAAGLRSVFAQASVAGLGAMIGLQSLINIAVNLRALPAKGMTLPFVSYGGSSLLATGLALGLILALTRAPAGAARRKEIMP